MLREVAVAAIRTSKLSKDYGLGRGLFELDLDVAQQEVFGCLGPNGAGKTTTIRLLMGMIRPTSGAAHIFGLDCRRDSVALIGGFAFASYLISEVGPLLKWPEGVQNLSAFKLFGTPLESGVDLAGLATMLAIILVGLGASVLLMQRRDIGG